MFSVVSFLITLRETIEAALIIGILLIYVIKIDKRKLSRDIWIGTIVGILVSIGAAFAFNYLLGGFDQYEKYIEGFSMVIVAILLTWMIIWMQQTSKNIKSKLESRINQSIKNEQRFGLMFLAFITVPQKSRWKSLKKLAQQITESIGKKNRKLFSAVRLIVVFALFDHLMESVPQLILSTLPEEVIPQPFKRKKKGKLPIKLLMKKEFVITREGNAKVLTTKVKKQGWTELGFPQRGKKKAKARVLFHPKVLEYYYSLRKYPHFGCGYQPFRRVHGDI
jgi:hypothetical protein